MNDYPLKDNSPTWLKLFHECLDQAAERARARLDEIRKHRQEKTAE
jgi:hypothetical protein